jgi:hypothetical protein
MSRNNVIENFEACYLRENMCKKAFQKKKSVSKLMSENDFNRCVKYITNNTFKKNKSILLRHGFDYDDMLSIVTIIGIQFINNPFVGKTKKDTYYILMRFINQKMETFFLFLDRKFRIKERYDDLSLEDIFPADVYHGEYPIVSAEIGQDDESDLSPNITPKNENKFKGMKEKLLTNLDLYSDDLARLATSKHVEYDVRKKAKSICKQNSIDYIAWAKSLIKKNFLDANDFVLED